MIIIGIILVVWNYDLNEYYFIRRYWCNNFHLFFMYPVFLASSNLAQKSIDNDIKLVMLKKNQLATWNPYSSSMNELKFFKIILFF